MWPAWVVVLAVAQGAGVQAATEVAGLSEVRRLTGVEYRNSVRDLLGMTKLPIEQLPLDEAIAGFDANAVAPVGRPLVETYIAAAEALAAAAPLLALLPTDCEELGHGLCAAQFAKGFLRRAFRRPTGAAELRRFTALFEVRRGTPIFETSARQFIAATLASPSFLYRGRGVVAATQDWSSRHGAYELATRLSYFLWATTPDDRLLDLAESGALLSPATLEGEARRLLADSRAGEARRSFFHQWLGLTRYPDKSRRTYPDWGPELWASMRQEIDAFVDDLFTGGDGRLTTLLAASYTFVDTRLASLYGVPVPKAPGSSRVELPSGQRAGVLTSAALLSALSRPSEPSPIHRGKFVRENLLCQGVPDPPPNIDITPPPMDPTKPTKERFAEHRESGVCSRCHALMDPIGFGFQRYDGVGRWRSTDGNFPVDDGGEIAGSVDADGAFVGARALADRLVRSPEVQMCMTRQWFRFAMGRAESAEDMRGLRPVFERFVGSGLDMRELVIALATSDLFRGSPLVLSRAER